MAEICVVSGDSDFTPMINRLRSDGISIIVFGPKTTTEGLKASCNSFVSLEDLQNGIAASVSTGHTSSSNTFAASRVTATARQIADTLVGQPRLVSWVCAERRRKIWLHPRQPARHPLFRRSPGGPPDDDTRSALRRCRRVQTQPQPATPCRMQRPQNTGFPHCLEFEMLQCKDNIRIFCLCALCAAICFFLKRLLTTKDTKNTKS